MVAISSCSTVAYVISVISSLSLIQANEDKDTRMHYSVKLLDDLFEFILFASLIYAILMMEGVGSLFLEIIFE